MARKSIRRPSDVEISGTKTLRPTPDILDALKQDYPLEASIADLVDNSIDAGAKKVLVRFFREGERLVSLCVADDGHGMDGVEIDRAMQFAAKRKYRTADLGMFGVGLKTASLSQADTLTVFSRRKGRESAGRQWTKAGIKQHDWQVNVLTPRSVSKVLARDWGKLGAIRSGTVVRWDDVADFGRLREGVDAYIQNAKKRIHLHLGLKLHRFLQRRRVAIQIDVQEVQTEDVGPPATVGALNPFPPSDRSGAHGYPKLFTVRPPGMPALVMKAHIWRKKSADPGYKLGGGKVAEHQGFYFFRHDRLIQDGGWSELIGTNEPHLSLARVEVDIPDRYASYLQVRSNKDGVDVPPSFSDAVFAAKAKDGTTFREFIEKAKEVYRTRGELKPQPMLRPGDGIPSDVRKVLEAHGVPLYRGAGCSVVWGRPAEDTFLEVDPDNRAVILNESYRRSLLRGARGGATDLPLVRTLLYFVFEGPLAGDRLGKLERLRTQAIQEAMNVALKAEMKWVGE